MQTYFRRRLAQTVFPLTLSLSLVMGCGDQAVLPSVKLVDRTTKALSIGAFTEISGSYGHGCTNRSGAWSIGLNGYTALAHPSLSVPQGDIGCELSVSAVRAGSPAGNTLYSLGDSLSLGLSFWQTSPPFKRNLGSPADFYANMRVTPDLTFTSDFTIDMIYSEDPSLLTTSLLASYYEEPVVRSSVTSAGISAPDYRLDISGLAVQVNDQKVVRSAVGSAALLTRLVPGQSYVVSNLNLGEGPSFGDVDAAFLGGAKWPLGPLPPTNLVPADVFELIGADLSTSAIRTLIVANEVAGARSYEVFEIRVDVPQDRSTLVLR